jgi:hypothetical protein
MRLPTFPSQEDLSLFRMRNAFRSAEVISALISAGILWPLLLFAAFGVAVIIGSTRTGGYPAMMTSMILVTAVIVLTGGVYFLLDWFFQSAGCLASIVSLMLAGLCIFLAKNSFLQLVALAQAGGSDLSVTFAISFSYAVGYLFFLHGIRVGILDQVERRILSRNPVKELVARRIRRYSEEKPRQLTSSNVRAVLFQIIAKMAQGLSAYLLAFLFGATLFHAMTLLLVVVYSTFATSFAGFGTWLFRICTLIAVVLTISFLLIQGAFGLKRRARLLTRSSFAETVDRDKRPPILFLRSFMDDQVTLPKPPVVLTYWMAEPLPRRLDHALIERFGYLAPVVAIGKPDEKDLPFGAARLFVPDREWQDTVLDLATRAQHVVVVVDESPGIDWEVEDMLAEPFVDKSLFLASPKLAPLGLETHSRLAPLLPPNLKLSKNYHVLAAFRDDKTWRWLTAKKITADDYIICCQAFLRRDLAKAASGIITETS